MSAAAKTCTWAFSLLVCSALRGYFSISIGIKSSFRRCSTPRRHLGAGRRPLVSIIHMELAGELTSVIFSRFLKVVMVACKMWHTTNM
jgi:hypothetical protein